MQPTLREIELQTVAVKGIDAENQLDADAKIGEIERAGFE
jgi:hypothetical protein